MKEKADIIKKDKILKKDSNILDIGSNDGTFLNFLSKNKKINLFGMDPSAKKFAQYYDPKINLIVDYFEKKKIQNKINNDIKFSLITSFAMFYDIADPNKFCNDIENFLKPDGKWILELSYFPL